MINSTKYLIVGNSAGGIAAAEAIREIDKDSSLTVVSDEPYPAYSRVTISKYLARESNFDKMRLRSPDFYNKNNIDFLPGKKVIDIITQDKAVKLEDGEKIIYEKLLIAAGGKPIVPSIDGMDKPGIFTFNKLDDAKAIDQYLNGNKEVVVVGGGLIGVSVTEAFYKRGINVTIVELKNRILNSILDEYASTCIYERITKAGVNILTGCTVIRVEGDRKVEKIVLDNNQEIPCQLLILAIGVIPRIELAKGTDIKTNRGILVDKHMKTNCDDIYACGDVAEAYDFVNEVDRVIPIWPGAYNGGRIAGKNMAGINIEYDGITSMNSLVYFGLNIASAGIVSPPDDSYMIIKKNIEGVYQKLVIKDDKIVGMVFIGRTEKAAIVLSLMKEKLNVKNCNDLLTTEDAHGLIYLRWRKKLEKYSTQL